MSKLNRVGLGIGIFVVGLISTQALDYGRAGLGMEPLSTGEYIGVILALGLACVMISWGNE